MVSVVLSSCISRLIIQIHHFFTDLAQISYGDLILGANSKSKRYYGLEGDIMLKLAIFVIFPK